ncbi:preprotein translocase subunit SecA, partial [Candidatus Microgenomates bacterium]|nr:preprotein translocase subunit SecA [Candidatus Microgenomates bacterium]
MFNPLKKFFDFNARETGKYQKVVDEINALEDRARKLKDDDFPKETRKLMKETAAGRAIEESRPWAFALVREAARRSIGQRHYDVQLIAGLALSDGRIAEQKTGEGKTLSATLALYTHALSGRGVHLVTVNDYLARRDAGWMGSVFNFLGLTTSAIISNESLIFDPQFVNDGSDPRLIHLRPISRREAYAADVTYGINSEFGFDYLRDNMVMNSAEWVQRGHHFAIVDEADSVLIDEARTPHIISSSVEEDTSRYYGYAKIVKQLNPKDDYVIDEKARSANLTEAGVSHVEQLLGVTNLYEKDFDTLFHVEAALKAETLFKNDKEYIVRNGEVIIVDEFTGRLLEGRRFSEGIHQAIEAKENVGIQRESKTLATVSLQNYFRKYERLGGMTGTAATEAEEFHKIYQTDVVAVPTHRQVSRKDEPDMIYKTERAKFNAVVEEVAEQHKLGRPVLIGTTAIDKNEHLAKLLRQKQVPHQLLNAKNHEEEALIIANAGRRGAVTVATNMAGRGVDIILGGDQNTDDTKKKNKKDTWQKEHDEVVALGGLYIIGTERHESRRIDNQLRGRAGRQGDPGQTRFFVSLEDDLMRIFGGEQISKLMTFFNLPEDQPLTHAMVSRAIEQAQVKVEGYNFDIRKNLVEYDDVLNKQRDIVYDLRRKLLTQPESDEEGFRQTLSEVFNEIVQSFANQAQLDDFADNPEQYEAFIKEVNLFIPAQQDKISELVDAKDTEGLIAYFTGLFDNECKKREKKFGKQVWFDVIRFMFLSTIDTFFTQHLTSIDDLREGIGLRRHAQLDPLIQYKNEAFSMFEQLLRGIYFEGARRIFNVEITQGEQPPVLEPKKQEGLIFEAAEQTSAFKAPAAKKEKKAKTQPPKKGPSDSK